MPEICVLEKNYNQLMIKVLACWKSVIVAAIILYVSLLREPHFALPTFAHSDKFAHVILYLLLGAMAYWDSERANVGSRARWIIAAVIPILYGGVIELLQEWWFYPRRGDCLDWLADAVGVIVGNGIVAMIYFISKKRNYDTRMD